MNHRQSVAPARENLVESLLSAVSAVVLDKEHQIKLSLSCILAQGHLLLQDLPGMGKTTLAQVLAKVLGLDYARVQFTSDLMPADLLGISIYNRQSSSFDFQPGPVFHQLLLADEINRASPKTQSALLEAMEERQVSIEGTTRMLPTPFFVIATQNPSDQSGTFELPESQLDRFLMRLSLGYPSPRAELKLLQGMDCRAKTELIQPVLNQASLISMQSEVKAVAASEQLLGYVQRLVAASRESSAIRHGISPRAGIALVNAAKAWAFIHHRNFVVAEDVQHVFSAVIAHRLQANSSSVTDEQLSHNLLASVDVI